VQPCPVAPERDQPNHLLIWWPSWGNPLAPPACSQETNALSLTVGTRSVRSCLKGDGFTLDRPLQVVDSTFNRAARLPSHVVRRCLGNSLSRRPGGSGRPRPERQTDPTRRRREPAPAVPP
jgi:hypothetical protein